MHKKNYGRGGDTQIRKVAGKDSHVTAFEAYLIDQHKEYGEDMVKGFVNDPTAVYGSGTTNPMTGMPEYGSKTFAGKDSGINKTWQWLTPSGGTHWFSSEENKGGKTYTERKSKQVVREGLDRLEQTTEKGLGYIEQEKEISQDQNTMKTSLEMQNNKSTTDQLTKKSNMATNKNIDDIENKGREETLNTYNNTQTANMIKFDKETNSYLQNMNRQMNDLLAGYQTATGEVYSGGTGNVDRFFEEEG